MIYLLVSPLLYICILSHNCVVSLRVLPPESRKEGVKITPVNLHTHWRDSISYLSTKESPVPVFCKVRAAVHILYRKPVPKCTEKKNREEVQFGAPKYDYYEMLLSMVFSCAVFIQHVTDYDRLILQKI